MGKKACAERTTNGGMKNKMETFVILLQIMQVISIFVIGYFLTLYNKAFVFQNEKFTKNSFFQKYTRRIACIVTWFSLAPQTILALLYITDRTNVLEGLTPEIDWAFITVDNTVIEIFIISIVGLFILNRSFKKVANMEEKKEQNVNGCDSN